jgi:hypothetical protein
MSCIFNQFSNEIQALVYFLGFELFKVQATALDVVGRREIDNLCERSSNLGQPSRWVRWTDRTIGVRWLVGLWPEAKVLTSIAIWETCSVWLGSTMSLVSLAWEANSETVAPSTFISGLKVSGEEMESSNCGDSCPVDGSDWVESDVAVGWIAGSTGILGYTGLYFFLFLAGLGSKCPMRDAPLLQKKKISYRRLVMWLNPSTLSPSERGTKTRSCVKQKKNCSNAKFF